MKTFLIIFGLSVAALAVAYWYGGPFYAGYGAGLYVLGWAGHKHRAYLRSIKDRGLHEYESVLERWFGA